MMAEQKFFSKSVDPCEASRLASPLPDDEESSADSSPLLAPERVYSGSGSSSSSLHRLSLNRHVRQESGSSGASWWGGNDAPSVRASALEDSSSSASWIRGWEGATSVAEDSKRKHFHSDETNSVTSLARSAGVEDSATPVASLLCDLDDIASSTGLSLRVDSTGCYTPNSLSSYQKSNRATFPELNKDSAGSQLFTHPDPDICDIQSTRSTYITNHSNPDANLISDLDPEASECRNACLSSAQDYITGNCLITPPSTPSQDAVEHSLQRRTTKHTPCCDTLCTVNGQSQYVDAGKGSLVLSSAIPKTPEHSVSCSFPSSFSLENRAQNNQLVSSQLKSELLHDDPEGNESTTISCTGCSKAFVKKTTIDGTEHYASAQNRKDLASRDPSEALAAPTTPCRSEISFMTNGVTDSDDIGVTPDHGGSLISQSEDDRTPYSALPRSMLVICEEPCSKRERDGLAFAALTTPSTSCANEESLLNLSENMMMTPSTLSYPPIQKDRAGFRAIDGAMCSGSDVVTPGDTYQTPRWIETSCGFPTSITPLEQVVSTQQESKPGDRPLRDTTVTLPTSHMKNAGRINEPYVPATLDDDLADDTCGAENINGRLTLTTNADETFLNRDPLCPGLHPVESDVGCSEKTCWSGERSRDCKTADPFFGPGQPRLSNETRYTETQTTEQEDLALVSEPFFEEHDDIALAQAVTAESDDYDTEDIELDAVTAAPIIPSDVYFDRIVSSSNGFLHDDIPPASLLSNDDGQSAHDQPRRRTTPDDHERSSNDWRKHHDCFEKNNTPEVSVVTSLSSVLPEGDECSAGTPLGEDSLEAELFNAASPTVAVAETPSSRRRSMSTDSNISGQSRRKEQQQLQPTRSCMTDDVLEDDPDVPQSYEHERNDGRAAAAVGFDWDKFQAVPGTPQQNDSPTTKCLLRIQRECESRRDTSVSLAEPSEDPHASSHEFLSQVSGTTSTLLPQRSTAPSVSPVFTFAPEDNAISPRRLLTSVSAEPSERIENASSRFRSMASVQMDATVGSDDERHSWNVEGEEVSVTTPASQGRHMSYDEGLTAPTTYSSSSSRVECVVRGSLDSSDSILFHLASPASPHPSKGALYRGQWVSSQASTGSFGSTRDVKSSPKPFILKSRGPSMDSDYGQLSTSSMPTTLLNDSPTGTPRRHTSKHQRQTVTLGISKPLSISRSLTEALTGASTQTPVLIAPSPASTDTFAETLCDEICGMVSSFLQEILENADVKAARNGIDNPSSRAADDDPLVSGAPILTCQQTQAIQCVPSPVVCETKERSKALCPAKKATGIKKTKKTKGLKGKPSKALVPTTTQKDPGSVMVAQTPSDSYVAPLDTAANCVVKALPLTVPPSTLHEKNSVLDRPAPAVLLPSSELPSTRPEVPVLLGSKTSQLLSSRPCVPWMSGRLLLSSPTSVNVKDAGFNILRSSSAAPHSKLTVLRDAKPPTTTCVLHTVEQSRTQAMSSLPVLSHASVSAPTPKTCLQAGNTPLLSSTTVSHSTNPTRAASKPFIPTTTQPLEARYAGLVHVGQANVGAAAVPSTKTNQPPLVKQDAASLLLSGGHPAPTICFYQPQGCSTGPPLHQAPPDQQPLQQRPCHIVDTTHSKSPLQPLRPHMASCPPQPLMSHEIKTPSIEEQPASKTYASCGPHASKQPGHIDPPSAFLQKPHHHTCHHDHRHHHHSHHRHHSRHRHHRQHRHHRSASSHRPQEYTSDAFCSCREGCFEPSLLPSESLMTFEQITLNDSSTAIPQNSRRFWERQKACFVESCSHW